MEAEDRFLDSLETVSGGAARVELDGIHQAFHEAFPHLDGSPERRSRIRAMLDALAGRNLIRLPADLRRGWQAPPTPALPLFLSLIRSPVQKPAGFDHRSFPWRAELAFVVSLKQLRNPYEARQLHEFFKAGGATRPIVPVKERSLQIFGDEKRLEKIVDGELFRPGRLTLADLRCRVATQILTFCPCPRPNRNPIIIIENEATFHSFCRLNHQLSLFAGVVYGCGNVVTKAVDFLRELTQRVGSGYVYFGDLDAAGINIALRVRAKMDGVPFDPAELYYSALLDMPGTVDPETESVNKMSLEWFSPVLRAKIKARLESVGRLPQEWIGWEALCAMHGAAADSSFELGFPGFGLADERL